MADACRALDVPVVGGNVSLYNEGPDGPDLPDARRRHGRRAARRRARRPARLRARGRRDRVRRALPAVAAAAPSWRSCAASRCPTGCRTVDVARGARARWRSCATRSAAASCARAHDVAEGGLAVALAECCLGGRPSARRSTSAAPAERALLELLFGEGAGGFVLSGPRPALAALAREIPLTLRSAIVGGRRRLDAGARRRRDAHLAARRAARRARRRARGRSADRRSAVAGTPAAAATLAPPGRATAAPGRCRSAETPPR